MTRLLTATKNRRLSGRRVQPSEGLSLLELVMVLACGAILLTVSVPAIGKLQQEWNLWSAAHLLESSMFWGRSHAVSANSSLQFSVEDDGKAFVWLDPESGMRLEGTMRYLPVGIRIVGFPRKPLRFYPRGNAAPAGTYTLQGEAGFYRVVVNPAGRIRIERD